MRSAQITMKLELFGEQAWDGHHETITVYADANTPHEALNAATFELLDALQQQGHKLPDFGRREHSSTPSAAGLTEEQKNEARKQRNEAEEQRRNEFVGRLLQNAEGDA